MKLSPEDIEAIAEAVVRRLHSVERDQIVAVDSPSACEQGGFVYFVRCDGPNSPVKIGIAGDVRSRLKSLRSSNPYPIVLVGWRYAEDPGALEQTLHQMFAATRIRGEWFAWSAALQRYIDRAESAP